VFTPAPSVRAARHRLRALQGSGIREIRYRRGRNAMPTRARATYTESSIEITEQ